MYNNPKMGTSINLDPCVEVHFTLKVGFNSKMGSRPKIDSISNLNSTPIKSSSRRNSSLKMGIERVNSSLVGIEAKKEIGAKKEKSIKYTLVQKCPNESSITKLDANPKLIHIL